MPKKVKQNHKKLSFHIKKSMDKVKIKRDKRIKKKVGKKEKALAALGLGGTILGGLGAVAPKDAKSQFVRTQESSELSATGKLKQKLKDIFGIKKAQAALDVPTAQANLNEAERALNAFNTWFDTEWANTDSGGWYDEISDTDPNKTNGDARKEQLTAARTAEWPALVNVRDAAQTAYDEAVALESQPPAQPGSTSGGPGAVAAAVLSLSGSLPSGTQGQAYNGSISASGGNGSYAYLLWGGDLPSGLNVDWGSGAVTGAIDSNAPVQNYNFTIRAHEQSDPNIYIDQSFTISVNAKTAATAVDLAVAGSNSIQSGSEAVYTVKTLLSDQSQKNANITSVAEENYVDGNFRVVSFSGNSFVLANNVQSPRDAVVNITADGITTSYTVHLLAPNAPASRMLSLSGVSVIEYQTWRQGYVPDLGGSIAVVMNAPGSYQIYDSEGQEITSTIANAREVGDWFYNDAHLAAPTPEPAPAPTVQAPTISGITPASGLRGQSVNVVISGQNLAGSVLSFPAGSKITVSNAQINSTGTELSANLAIAADAAAGAKSFTLTKDSLNIAGSFNVTLPATTAANAPQATGLSLSASTVVRGGSYTVNFTGANITANTFWDVLVLAPGQTNTSQATEVQWHRGTGPLVVNVNANENLGIYRIISVRAYNDPNAKPAWTSINNSITVTASAAAPTTASINKTTFKVGEEIVVTVSGQANMPVFATAGGNTVKVGNTNDVGSFTYRAVLTNSEVGNWDEIWAVGRDAATAAPAANHLFFTVQSAAVAGTFTFTNDTNPAARTFAIGDKWKTVITGTLANKPVWVSGTRNGQSFTPVQVGATNASGSAALSAVIGEGDAGLWQQYWTVGDSATSGENIGSISFEVMQNRTTISVTPGKYQTFGWGNAGLTESYYSHIAPYVLDTVKDASGQTSYIITAAVGSRKISRTFASATELTNFIRDNWKTADVFESLSDDDKYIYAAAVDVKSKDPGLSTVFIGNVPVANTNHEILMLNTKTGGTMYFGFMNMTYLSTREEAEAMQKMFPGSRVVEAPLNWMPGIIEFKFDPADSRREYVLILADGSRVDVGLLRNSFHWDGLKYSVDVGQDAQGQYIKSQFKAPTGMTVQFTTPAQPGPVSTYTAPPGAAPVILPNPVASPGLTATGTGTGAAVKALSITTPGTLPKGVAGQSYNQTLQTQNGTSGRVIWSVTSGIFPSASGLSLDVNTGKISGALLSMPGTYKFTVAAFDLNTGASAIKEFNLTIEPRPVARPVVQPVTAVLPETAAIDAGVEGELNPDAGTDAGSVEGELNLDTGTDAEGSFWTDLDNNAQGASGGAVAGSGASAGFPIYTVDPANTAGDLNLDAGTATESDFWANLDSQGVATLGPGEVLGSNPYAATNQSASVYVTSVQVFDTKGSASQKTIGPGYKIEIGGVGLEVYKEFYLEIGTKEYPFTQTTVTANKISLIVPQNLPTTLQNGAFVAVRLATNVPNVQTGTLRYTFVWQASQGGAQSSTDSAATDFWNGLDSGGAKGTGASNQGAAANQNQAASQNAASAADNEAIKQLRIQIENLDGRIAELSGKLNNQTSAGELQRANQEIAALRQQISDLTANINRLQTGGFSARTFDAGGTQAAGGPQMPQGLQMPPGYPASGGGTAGAQNFWDNLNAGGGQVQSANIKGSYKVKKGDTLWAIAKKYYGDGRQWRKILAVNPDCLSRPGNTMTLRIGFELRIPE